MTRHLYEGRDLIGYGPNPPRIEWPGGAAVAVSLCVNYEEGSEYSYSRDRKNEGLAEIPYAIEDEYRDLCVESVYEYGSRAGVWRILRLLEEHGTPATFFAAAEALQRNPEVAVALTKAGHEPCAHGFRWEEHWKLTREEEAERIHAAVELISSVCGRAPVGWYCRYGPSVNTRALLIEHGGFTYDSDSYSDDLPYVVEKDGSPHVVVPYTLVCNDGRYVLAQGFSAASDFVETCTRHLDELRREAQRGAPKMMSVGLHPRWTGQPSRASGLREFLETALAAGDVWFATREQIANWWLEHAHS